MKKNLFLLLSVALYTLNALGQTNVIQNGSFENDLFYITPWTSSAKFSNFGAYPCVGARIMLTADGAGSAYSSLTNEYVQQNVAIPANSTSATLNFWYKLNTDNANSGVNLKVYFGATNLATYYYASSNNSCKSVSISIPNISSFSGQNVIVKFVANESGSNAYWGKVYVDDVSLNITSVSGTNSTAPTSASASPSSITSGNSSTLTVTGGSLGTGASWKWYSGSCGGTYIASGNSISVSPTSTTTYWVRAEGTYNTTSCASTIVTVTSGSNPTNSTAPTSASASPSSITSGNSSTLTVTGGSLGTGATWKWYSGSCGGTYIASGNSISLSPTSTTTYWVRAEGTYNTTSCASTIVNITNPPAPIADFYSNMNNIKPDTTVSFTDNSQNGPLTWQWTFDGGTPGSSTSPNPTVTYQKPGVYRVKLTVSNNSGSHTKSIPGYITVSPNGTNQSIPPPKNAIHAPQCTIADPIQIGTGTYNYSHKDFNIPTVNGSINFTRFYNTVNNTLNSSLGYGWSHAYNFYIDIQRDVPSLQDTVWSIHYPDGHLADFIPLYTPSQGIYPRTSFPLYSGTLDSLVMLNSNKFILYSKDNHQYHFNALGQLTQITDLNNNVTTISYTGNNISSIVGQGGRYLNLSYTGSYVSSITETNNRKYNFTYDANGNLITSKDPKGGITKFTYDVNHRMTAIINSLGDTIVNNTFDTQGRVIKQKDAYNQITSFDYDTPSVGNTKITNPDNSQIIAIHDKFFRKTNVKDELGLTTSYTYDDKSNETSFTNENGQTESRQFDWFGNIKTKTIASNITSQYNYNNFNSPIQITDPNGKSTVITYDGKNNPTAIHLPDNTFQYFTYNSDGTKNKFTDGRNNSTTYTYSTAGDMLSSIAPNGTKSYGYDPSGRLISVTDENNHQTQMQYDDNDNIKILTDALLLTTEFTYDANNQLLSVKDKNGNLTTFSYDKKGRLKTNTNPKGGITTYAYDSRDNIISITDPLSNVVGLTYDKKGRKLSISDALGTTQYQYDGVGNRTKVTDGTGKATVFSYTLTNKIQSIKDGLMNSTTYTYDKNDNLISMINALNKTTVYSYNDMNRLVSVLDAANKTTTITYDENGNKKTITDPNGHAQSFNYDAANRLILHTDAAGNNSSYSYDQAGNILSTTTPTGTISKSYDYSNRVLTITNSGGNNYTFTYDKNDNIATMNNSIGTSTMVYDNLNRLTQYADPYNITVSFTYDLMGNKTSITYPGNHKVSYQYDNANNLKSVTDWLNKTFTYTYDAAGRNTQLIYPNGIKCDFVFDDAARLLSKKNTTSTNLIINSSQFVIDATGNRTSEQRQGPIPTYLIPSSKAYSYSNDDGLKTNAVWNYTNDAAGNRTLETKGSKSVKYSFSVDNLLSNIIDTTGVTTNFNYDPLGHRLSKTAGSTQSRYVLDLSNGLSQVLQITDASGALKSEYVYGLGLLESIDATSNAAFYHYDAQHNTVALSNQTAAITDTYTYDPFGTLLAHAGNATQPFTFLGEFGVEQENTSLYFVRARYYDSANGRFLSKDIFPGELNSPQTINRYSYGINNPISNIDPTGLISWNSLYTTGIATAQALSGLGNLAQAALSGIVAAGSGYILGPSAVLSGAGNLNDATKDFKAALSNYINAGNDDYEWVTADSYKGALDYVGFDNSSVKVLRDFNDVIRIAHDFKDIQSNINNSPKTLSNIFTSNYSTSEKLGFVSKYIFSSENRNPIKSLDDLYDGIKGAISFKPDLINSINKAKTGK